MLSCLCLSLRFHRCRLFANESCCDRRQRASSKEALDRLTAAVARLAEFQTPTILCVKFAALATTSRMANVIAAQVESITLPRELRAVTIVLPASTVAPGRLIARVVPSERTNRVLDIAAAFPAAQGGSQAALGAAAFALDVTQEDINRTLGKVNAWIVLLVSMHWLRENGAVPNACLDTSNQIRWKAASLAVPVSSHTMTMKVQSSLLVSHSDTNVCFSFAQGRTRAATAALLATTAKWECT